MTLKYVIIGAIIATLTAALPVKAGDIDCNAGPNQKYCTGEEGAGEMVFCDVAGVEREK